MSVQEHHFQTSDNTAVFYRHIPAKTESNKAIVLFHRGHEHSGQILFLADELGLEDFHYFAWDARGHGLTEGERGDSPSIGRSVADVDEFIRHIQREYQIAAQDMVVIAQSVGAVLVSAWLHDYAPKIRCAVLASPAFSVKLYVPFAEAGLKFWYRRRGNFFVNSYVKAHYLTHNQERIDSYNKDPLIARAISVRILLGLYATGRRVVADAQAITTPVQLLISGSDWVVNQQPQHQFYNRLGSHIKERHVMPGFYHDTLGEKERHKALAEINRFIRQRFAEPYAQVDSTHADQYGFSRQEADELASPLPRLSVKNIYWQTQKALMKLGSRWSKGLQTGEQTGYDSGSTLDYVYRNEAQGTNAFGRWVDRNYLNAIGWRGIRQRKVNIETALRQAISTLREQRRAVHLLDIASGHGRYILDALTDGYMPDSIQLRDYSPINVEAGQKMIAERGLSEIATFVQKDAFDPASYREPGVTPTLGVVSGLLELFPKNALISTALSGLGQLIETGGYLIYTNQPYHPQLEMIARCLSSHRNGEAWVMRRRSQQEMDQLAERAGFEKIRQWIDEDGIFTVSLAIKK